MTKYENAWQTMNINNLENKSYGTLYLIYKKTQKDQHCHISDVSNNFQKEFLTKFLDIFKRMLYKHKFFNAL